MAYSLACAENESLIKTVLKEDIQEMLLLELKLHGILKESLIHWSRELWLGLGRDRGVVLGSCGGGWDSSSSSSPPSSSSSSE